MIKKDVEFHFTLVEKPASYDSGLNKDTILAYGSMKLNAEYFALGIGQGSRNQITVEQWNKIKKEVDDLIKEATEPLRTLPDSHDS